MDRIEYVLQTSLNKSWSALAVHTIGELLKKNPYSDGIPSTFPEGWVMEFNAIGTKAQKADCQET